MAVTITVSQLAAALRLSTDASVVPEEPLLSILHRQLAVASDTVNDYAAEASDETANVAVIRMVGVLYDQPSTALNNSPRSTPSA